MRHCRVFVKLGPLGTVPVLHTVCTGQHVCMNSMQIYVYSTNPFLSISQQLQCAAQILGLSCKAECRGVFDILYSEEKLTSMHSTYSISTDYTGDCMVHMYTVFYTKSICNVSVSYLNTNDPNKRFTKLELLIIHNSSNQISSTTTTTTVTTTTATTDHTTPSLSV